MSLPTVVCVCKTGGIYTAEHVTRLWRQVEQHAPQTAFVCLTDDPAVNKCYGRRLWNAWPGWWSKIEAFLIPGPCLCLDLDVNVVGDLGPLLEIARQEPLVMCTDFRDRGDPKRVNASVVGWSGDVRLIYERFAASPEAFMAAMWSDQEFVRDHWPGPITRWQHVLPGKVLSFKRNLLRNADWADARVIASHGVPKPWDPGGADEWISRRTSYT